MPCSEKMSTTVATTSPAFAGVTSPLLRSISCMTHVLSGSAARTEAVLAGEGRYRFPGSDSFDPPLPILARFLLDRVQFVIRAFQLALLADVCRLVRRSDRIQEHPLLALLLRSAYPKLVRSLYEGEVTWTNPPIEDHASSLSQRDLRDRVDGVVARRAQRVEPFQSLFSELLRVANVVHDRCLALASTTLVSVAFEDARPDFLPRRTIQVLLILGLLPVS